MRILVVGASGFLGREVSRELSARGHDVRGAAGKSGTLIEMDIADRQSCRAVLSLCNADAIINLAGVGATSGSVTEREMLRVNHQGARCLAQTVVSEEGAPWFVHVSSSTESADEPESEYARSKALGTRAVQEEFERAETPYAIAKVHNTYGPTQPEGRFVMNVFRRMLSGTRLHLRYPDRVRDFCAVVDVSAHLADLVERRRTDQVLCEVGTGEGTTLWNAAQTIRRRVGAAEELIGRELPLAGDLHGSVVADKRGAGFLRCATPFESGVDLVARTIA